MRPATLLKMIGAVAAISSSSIERAPCVLWNTSASVSVGIYILGARDLRRGDIIALRLPYLIEKLAVQRRYLPVSGVMLKPIAALRGDGVCRWHTGIFINGRYRANAAHLDGAQRRLPAWQGCRLLHQNEIFVLSPSSGSFDSRYFGPIPVDLVIGTAQPVLTF